MVVVVESAATDQYFSIFVLDAHQHLTQLLVTLQLILFGLHQSRWVEADFKVVLIPSLFLFSFQLLADFLSLLWVLAAQFVLPDTEKSLAGSALILGLSNFASHISMMVVFFLSKEVVAREKPTSKFTVWLLIAIALALVRVPIGLLYRDYSIIL